MRAEDKEFNSGSKNMEFSDPPREFAKSEEPLATENAKNRQEKKGQNEKSKRKLLQAVLGAAAVGVVVLTGTGRETTDSMPEDLRWILETVEEQAKIHTEDLIYDALAELLLEYLPEYRTSVLDANLEQDTWYGFDGTTVFLIEDGASYDFEGMVFEYSSGFLSGYIGNFENGTINGNIIAYHVGNFADNDMGVGNTCYFYDFTMEDAQLEGEVSTNFWGRYPLDDPNKEEWIGCSYEGNTNSKWVYEETIDASFKRITDFYNDDRTINTVHETDNFFDTFFDLDKNGCLIIDERFSWYDDYGDDFYDVKTYTSSGGTKAWTVYGLDEGGFYFSEDEEFISLQWIRQLPEILNCDYYIADEIDEDTDTQPDTQADTQADTQKDTQADTQTEQKKVENTKEPTVDITAEDVQLYTIGKPLVWDGYAEDGLSPNVYDDMITEEEPLPISKFVHDEEGVIYGVVGPYLYIPAVYLSETPVETYVEYEPLGEVWSIWDGDGKATTVTSSSHLYEDPNLNDGELVEVPLSDFTSVGETLYAKETCTYNGVKYKVLYFNQIRYLIDAWIDAE